MNRHGRRRCVHRRDDRRCKGGGANKTAAGEGWPTAKRRNSIMDLLEAHGDNSKQLISCAGFEALCEQLGLRVNATEKRRAYVPQATPSHSDPRHTQDNTQSVVA